MVIKRVSPVEFQFECENKKDLEEAQAIQQAGEFEFDGGTYIIRHITAGLEEPPIWTYSVIVK